ncbi:MAG: ABC transporter ATP-binding protein [Desulfobulbaceae bacterium]|nr:ABC transporter ATP-binding protein [Desulfobulbaceae bacterium]
MKEKHPLLVVKNLSVEFGVGSSTKLQAVSNVSFEIGTGETLGLVGESGCGKSTLVRALVRLIRPTAGQVFYGGENLLQCTSRRLKEIRPELQMIFQDATASLNPGRTIGKTIEEPLRVVGVTDKRDRTERARSMMHAVGLDPDQIYERYPFELSGGQCQRVSLARALIMKPRLLLCDEPVSSLDVSVQAQILNLLGRIKQRFALTILFISHDLAVVKNISDRVAVMYMGKICEIAGAEDLYRFTHHPYTEKLLSSIPNPEPEQQKKKARINKQGAVSQVTPHLGCRFYPKCFKAQSICKEIEPELTTIKNRQVACHLPL